MDMRRCGLLLVLLVATGCGSSGAPTAADRPAATPCSTTLAASGEQSIAFPHDGARVEVTVRVGDHVTVGWAGCGEHGTISTSPADSTRPLTSSDVSVYSSPRPTPSARADDMCCQRPPADGVFDVRYLAQMPGTQVLHGQGSAGSDGDIAVTVLSLPPEESRLVSGVVDSSGLRDHPAPSVVYFQPAGDNPIQTIAKPTADGRFSTRLRPGSYTVLALSPAYNDGRAQCRRTSPLVVGADDVTDVVVTCTER